MKNDLPISLIGFMGTGKTTIGKHVAKLLKRPFFDLDRLIEEDEGKTIPEIFTQYGEGYFRKKETELLRSLLEHNAPIVLSTGGGVVLNEENRKMLQIHSFVVCTTANRKEIVRRLQLKPGKRPLLVGNIVERVNTLMDERAPFYHFAHYKIATDRYGIYQSAKKIVQAYRSFEPIVKENG